MDGNNLIVGIIFILLILAFPFYYNVKADNKVQVKEQYTEKTNDNYNW